MVRMTHHSRFLVWNAILIFAIASSIVFLLPHHSKTPAPSKSVKFHQNADYYQEVSRLESTYKIRHRIGAKSVSNQKIILIVSRITSGSTFFAEIIQSADAKTFYSYEPLLFLDRLKRTSSYVGKNRNQFSAIALINDIISCNFSHRKSYVKFLKRYSKLYLYRNKFLWSAIKEAPNFNFMVEKFSNTCASASVNLIKINRLHMSQVGDFFTHLDANLRGRIQIIFLVRDPRGVYSSRRQRKGCYHDCKSILSICDDLKSNLDWIKYMRMKYNEMNSIIVRYEDIAIDPMEETRKIFNHLNLHFNQRVIKYIKSHTRLNGRQDRKYSTIRESKDVAFSWRQRLSNDEIISIDHICSKAMSMAGYETLNNGTNSNQIDFLISNFLVQ